MTIRKERIHASRQVFFPGQMNNRKQWTSFHPPIPGRYLRSSLCKFRDCIFQFFPIDSGQPVQREKVANDRQFAKSSRTGEKFVKNFSPVLLCGKIAFPRAKSLSAFFIRLSASVSKPNLWNFIRLHGQQKSIFCLQMAKGTVPLLVLRPSK